MVIGAIAILIQQPMTTVAAGILTSLTVYQGSVTTGSVISVDRVQGKVTKFLKVAGRSLRGKMILIAAQGIDDIVKAGPSHQPDTDVITILEIGDGDVVGLTATSLGIQGGIHQDVVKPTAVGRHHAEKEATTDINGILPIAVVEAADHLG